MAVKLSNNSTLCADITSNNEYRWVVRYLFSSIGDDKNHKVNHINIDQNIIHSIGMVLNNFNGVKKEFIVILLSNTSSNNKYIPSPA